MRGIGLLGALVVLVAAAPVAEAATPKRGCSTRGEGQRPITRFVQAGDVQIGPVAFKGLGRVATASGFKRSAIPRDGGYALKLPLFVRAGRVVTVSIAPAFRPVVGLAFRHEAPRPPRGDPAVRFAACDKDDPAWSYRGGVGPITFFPGGFWVKEPSCVTISVRLRGRARPYMRSVSFGMGEHPPACALL